ncbi:hypothetical protein [Natronococcus wangiae]|uniref:hypothetical protein n=1 Tax=Natronococcus wangiae TaxID=3068275 RepID=UPI00273E778F|nr:hypothetical protein [Natronococcus sp. AD5]
MESGSSSGNASRSPNRRRLLQLASLGGVSLLSGCTEDVGEELPPNREWPVAELKPKLPVEEQTEVLEERIEAMADAEIADEDEFAAAFDEYAFEIESVEREREVLTVEYVSTERYAEGTLHDVAPIAGAFAALLESGYDVLALGITALDGAPAAYGSASVEAEWTEAYNEGGLTAKEYGELVAGTIESERQPPEVETEPDE